MKLIVGLGNPGDKYVSARHNLGFMVVERFLKDFEPVKDTVWEDNKRVKSDIAIFEWQPKKGVSEKIILAKPKTYMNNSGMAVSLIAQYHKIKPEDIWIIHDELDLPLGYMKIRFGGSGAGHKGVESIISSLKNDKFWRFRLGIGTAHNHTKIGKHMIDKAEEYVLSGFGQGEYGKVRHLIKRGAQAIAAALEKGLEKAMNQYNTK